MRAKGYADPPHDAQAARSPSASRARRRWADLIKRVWQVDPPALPLLRLHDEERAIDELAGGDVPGQPGASRQAPKR